jgi:hypothetical protein
MPLQVNEHSINALAELTGVAVADLKAQIVVEADAAPTETKIKDLLTGTVIMKKENYDTLIDNTRKEKFDEGKTRALADIAKLAMGEKAIEVTKETKREDVLAKILDHSKQVWSKESGTPPAEWATEKSKLQGMVQEYENKYKELEQKIESTKGESAFREKALSAVSGINFSSAPEISSKQREVVLKNILSSYTRKVEDGKDVYYRNSDGQKLVDQYLNPKPIEDIAKEEAIIFPTTQASNGRGDQSSQNNQSSGNLDADLKAATSMDDLHKLLVARGLSSASAEGQALIRKWAEVHKKSA